MGWIYSIKKWRRLFPLRTTSAVISLVSHVLNDGSTNSGGSNTSMTEQPNLAFLSIVLGLVENRIVQTGMHELEVLMTGSNNETKGKANVSLRRWTYFLYEHYVKRLFVTFD